MNITEIGEELEQQFGKPRNVTAENVRFNHRTALRNAIGYTVTADGKVQFYNRKLERKNFLSIIVAYCRSIFRF